MIPLHQPEEDDRAGYWDGYAPRNFPPAADALEPLECIVIDDGCPPDGDFYTGLGWSLVILLTVLAVALLTITLLRGH